jgi:hypothetical protein
LTAQHVDWGAGNAGECPRPLSTDLRSQAAGAYGGVIGRGTLPALALTAVRACGVSESGFCVGPKPTMWTAQ